MNEHARRSWSALFTLALMIGSSGLAGCKSGGGGGGDGASTAVGSTSGTSGGNSAPTISGTAATSIATNGTYSFKPSAQDADGDTITFQIQNKPAWATFNTVTGELAGKPASAGTFSNIKISASDGKASSALPTFAIAVGASGSTGSGGPGITLSWTAPTENTDGSALTNLAGYVIAYGTSSTSLSQSVRLDNPSIDRYVFDQLSNGTYFFAIKAVNAEGTESALSSVVSKNIS
jgi:hypothetical protein